MKDRFMQTGDFVVYNLINQVLKLNTIYQRVIIFTFFFTLFLINSSRLLSQIEDENVSYQAWLDYNAKCHISKKFKIYGDVGYRKISPNIWTRYYIRPAVSYLQSIPLKSGKYLLLTYHAGLGTFFTNSTDTSNNTEIRPFQGVDVQWPTFKRLRINHYVRLEEQFYFANNSQSFDLRLRYMFSGIFHWNKENWNVMNNFYLPFHIELFWNLLNSSNTSNLIRITPGIGYTFNLKWKMEFSTSYHRNQIEITDAIETNNIVFRFRVYHNIFKKIK